MKIEWLKEEDYVYMDCTIRMSKNNMANIMYAAIITRSGLPTSFGVGIYEYSMKQNAYNNCDVKVYIHPSQITSFESYSGIKLRKPISITIQ